MIPAASWPLVGAVGQLGVYVASACRTPAAATAHPGRRLTTSDSRRQRRVHRAPRAVAQLHTGDPCHELAFAGDGASGQQASSQRPSAILPVPALPSAPTAPRQSPVAAARSPPFAALAHFIPSIRAIRGLCRRRRDGQPGSTRCPYGDSSCATAAIKVADRATAIPQGRGRSSTSWPSPRAGDTRPSSPPAPAPERHLPRQTLTRSWTSRHHRSKTLEDLRLRPRRSRRKPLVFAARFTDGFRRRLPGDRRLPGLNGRSVAPRRLHCGRGRHADSRGAWRPCE